MKMVKIAMVLFLVCIVGGVLGIQPATAKDYYFNVKLNGSLEFSDSGAMSTYDHGYLIKLQTDKRNGYAFWMRKSGYTEILTLLDGH